MQHEITTAGPLLGADGKLREPGWARSPILDYDRSAIRSPRWRIKEWDYYVVLAGDFGLALTVADNGYMGLLSATVLDFTRPWQTTDSVMTALPMGSWGLPPSSAAGATRAEAGGARMAFETEGGIRRLGFSWPDFGAGAVPPGPRTGCCLPLPPEDLAAARGRERVAVGLEGEIELRETMGESIVIATPFRRPEKGFYYNRKVNCLEARGGFKSGGREYVLEPSSCRGALDWGRGVWPWSNRWLWGSASGFSAKGEGFGFNIGYGFGDTGAASENCLFHGGRLHKLGRLEIRLDEKDFLRPWTVSSEDGRLEAKLSPILDRTASSDLGVLASIQHQVFGDWSGYAILDGGERLEFSGLRGFCEKVANRW